MDQHVALDVFFAHVTSYVGWSDDDAALVLRMRPHVEPRFGALVDDFYLAIAAHSLTSGMITGGAEQVARLKHTLREWLRSLFSGKYDLDFAVSRWRVGLRHVQIGLRQAYALAALARLRSGIIEALVQSPLVVQPDFYRALSSINKLLDIDAAIIDHAYQTANTERQEQETASRVKQSERLAAIGQMVTGLAHESRNALQRSHACLEALKLDIEDRPDALLQADRIQKALDRLNMLYEEVRNYASPINLEREPTDLVQLVKTVWASLEARRQAVRSEVELVVDYSDTVIVWADRNRLDQVFTNLLQNALDACGPRGVVRCTIRPLPSERVCQIDVEDDGPGIASKDMRQVFEPFYTTKTKGTGLGLAITRRIVEAHGGTISADRGTIGGARFTLVLPLQLQSMDSAVHKKPAMVMKWLSGPRTT